MKHVNANNYYDYSFLSCKYVKHPNTAKNKNLLIIIDTFLNDAKNYLDTSQFVSEMIIKIQQSRYDT